MISRSTSVQVTLPSDFTCDRCILQLVRQAGEWVATGGYVFWTCADIAIQDNDGKLLYILHVEQLHAFLIVLIIY